MAAQSKYNLPALRTGLKPFHLHYFPRLRSTSDHAAELRKAGKLYAPSIVLCGRQTAGRGRGSNTWWSPGGSIAATFILPIRENIQPQEIPLLAGLAVRQTCAMLAGNPGIVLKWPNDVLHHGRKLAGLLCERIARVDLVGIGLNVNVEPTEAPKNLREQITSLSKIAGRKIDINEVLIALAKNLRAIIRQ